MKIYISVNIKLPSEALTVKLFFLFPDFLFWKVFVANVLRF
jgi:hypothetical protein